jgi:hypothetical protein
VLLHAFVLVVAPGSHSPVGWALVMTYGIIPVLTLGLASLLRWALVMTYGIIPVLTLGLASLLRRAPVPTCDLTIVGILTAIVGLTVVSPKPTCCTCSDTMRRRHPSPLVAPALTPCAGT